jgi:hypothetical protein
MRAVLHSDDVFQRVMRRDPALLTALHSGDIPTAVAVGRLLRLTPLRVLAGNPSALVEVLASMPELHVRLRSAWSREDPVLTSRLFAWAEQARLHAARRGRAALTVAA